MQLVQKAKEIWCFCKEKHSGSSVRVVFITMGSWFHAYSHFGSAFDAEPQDHLFQCACFAGVSLLFEQKLVKAHSNGHSSSQEHFRIHYFSFDQPYLCSPSNLCLTDECISVMNIWEYHNLCVWQFSKWKRKTLWEELLGSHFAAQL